MKIAVVGGGFTGLACALSLLEKKCEVVVFEGEKTLGGLAGGIKDKNWKWSLEHFYHHVFTNDKDILSLAKKVGVKALINEPVTTSFINGKEIPLDSPVSVIKFPELSLFGRVRMGLGLAVLKLIPNGLFLEKYRVVDELPRFIGKEGYRVIWERLLRAKFGPFADKVNMSWFWARVAKRTKNLSYFEGGFQNLANKTGEKIESLGGKILPDRKIGKIEKQGEKWLVDGVEFDGVVMTTPAPVAETVLGKEMVTFPKISYLWGQTVVLELKEKLISGYWMNVLKNNWPFLVVVEHTNMINKKYYGNNRIVYLGNYLPEENKQLGMSEEKLIALYLPYLRKINKLFRKKWIKSIRVFRRPFAQPVFPINFSKEIPPVKSKMEGLYFANMSMVYPYDRGTNYAVKMGVAVARQVLNDIR